MSSFKIKIGTQDNLDILVRHRLNMWREIYPEMENDIKASEEMTRRWILDKLKEGKLIPFIAIAGDGQIAGSGCVLIKEDQPRPGSSQIDNPYLLSMYTEGTFRRLGVATNITREAISWCKNKGYDRMTLHASAQGKPIYQKLGFVDSNEMRLML